jgi:hypothetical protein
MHYKEETAATQPEIFQDGVKMVSLILNGIASIVSHRPTDVFSGALASHFKLLLQTT